MTQLPTSGYSLLICIKIRERGGERGRNQERGSSGAQKNGSLIRDQIMILRRGADEETGRREEEAGGSL